MWVSHVTHVRAFDTLQGSIAGLCGPFCKSKLHLFLVYLFFYPSVFPVSREHVIKNSRGLTFSSPLWPVLQEQVAFISCLPLILQCAFNIIGNIIGLMQYMGLLCGYVGLFCVCIRLFPPIHTCFRHVSTRKASWNPAGIERTSIENIRIATSAHSNASLQHTATQEAANENQKCFLWK